MLIENIVLKINNKLAGELLEYAELEQFMDEVIDDINGNLNSCYPTFSEFSLGKYVDVYPNYCFFPEEYVRKVVILGAAYKFYVQDEEGNITAPQYQVDYEQNLFEMFRDFVDLVPDNWRKHYRDSDIGVPPASLKMHEDGYRDREGRNMKQYEPNVVDFNILG